LCPYRLLSFRSAFGLKSLILHILKEQIKMPLSLTASGIGVRNISRYYLASQDQFEIFFQSFSQLFFLPS
jgi:hypothetical protein